MGRSLRRLVAEGFGGVKTLSTCVILPAVTDQPRRTIVAWTLYDFANSAFSAIIHATVFPLYFANVVVGNAEGRGDFLWGLVVSLSMAIVALSSPLLGGIAVVRHARLASDHGVFGRRILVPSHSECRCGCDPARRSLRAR